MKTIFSSTLLFLSAFAFSQQSNSEIIASASRILVNQYQPTETNHGVATLRIRGKYGSAELGKPSSDKASGAIIETVTLVYSNPSPGYNQDSLNAERLESLRKILPDAFSSPLTEFRLAAQNGKKNLQAGLFHGFDIRYRITPTKESMKAEAKALLKMMESETTTDVVSPAGSHSIEKFADAEEIPSAPATIAAAGDYVIHSCDTVLRADTYTDEFHQVKNKKGELVGTVGFTYDESGKLTTDKLYCYYSKPIPAPAFTIPVAGTFPEDDVVTKTLARHPEWKEMLIVCDVTGSMSPYSAQVFAWYKLHSLDKRVKSFVFFNDGDVTPDHLKVAGSTGGIYDVRAAAFDTVMAAAQKAMMSGGGGDCPENNVEAIISGMKKYPDSKEIILIADNWATPRDMKFISSVGRPVKVILCGATWGINPEYLNLARATGGSVHLMEDDLTLLAKMNEGETITIGKQQFKLSGGKFEPVKTTSL